MADLNFLENCRLTTSTPSAARIDREHFAEKMNEIDAKQKHSGICKIWPLLTDAPMLVTKEIISKKVCNNNSHMIMNASKCSDDLLSRGK